MKIKNLIIFCTRPESIKMAPLVNEFQKLPVQFETLVCISAQHGEILDHELDFCGINSNKLDINQVLI